MHSYARTRYPSACSHVRIAFIADMPSVNKYIRSWRSRGGSTLHERLLLERRSAILSLAQRHKTKQQAQCFLAKGTSAQLFSFWISSSKRSFGCIPSRVSTNAAMCGGGSLDPWQKDGSGEGLEDLRVSRDEILKEIQYPSDMHEGSGRPSLNQTAYIHGPNTSRFFRL